MSFSPVHGKPNKVLLLDPIPQEALDIYANSDFVVFEHFEQLSEAEIAKLIEDFNIVCIKDRDTEILTDEVLRSAHRLLGVAIYGHHTTAVNLKAARSMGIPVFHASHQRQHSISEMVIGYILTLSRQVGDRTREIHNTVWNKISNNCYEVRNKTIGIIGYGQVGSAVGVMAESLSMKVVFYDNVIAMPIGKATSCSTLNDLLSISDYVFVNVSPIEENKNFIGVNELAIMKPKSFIINTSFKDAIDLDALAASIKNGNIQGAAIDSHPGGDLIPGQKFESPLRGLPNVILSPSITDDTIEGNTRVAEEVSNAIIRYVEQGSTFAAVNFPSISAWPLKPGSRRIVNMHRNVRGVLREIDAILSLYNVGRQMLDTKENIGYLIADVESDDVTTEIVAQMALLASTIRTRIL